MNTFSCGVRDRNRACEGGGASQRPVFPGLNGKLDLVADKTQEAFAGRGDHGWIGLLHAKIFTTKRRTAKRKSIFLWVALGRRTF